MPAYERHREPARWSCRTQHSDSSFRFLKLLYLLTLHLPHLHLHLHQDICVGLVAVETVETVERAPWKLLVAALSFF